MPKYTTQVASGPSIMRSNGAFAVTGTTYAYTALSDESDGTYCIVSTGRTLPVDMLLAYPTLVAGERIVSVCPYVRSKQPGVNTSRAAVALTGWTPPSYNVPYVYEGLALNLPKEIDSATAYEVEAQNGQLLVPTTAAEWDPTIAGDSYPTLAFYDPHNLTANRTRWYEAGLYWYALKPATIATPTAPVTTVTDTQLPTCTATVSSIVESWQKPSELPDFLTGVTVEWSVYAGSMTVPAGTPLTLWTSHHIIGTYGDGATPTALACSSTPTIPLPNGALTLFARVSRDHPSNVAAYTDYVYQQWTQAALVPDTPTLTATVDDVAQGVAITVTAPSTAGYSSATCEVQVQRLIAADEWRDLRGMADLAIAVDTAVDCGDDYESERGVENTYRARVSMWHTTYGVRRYSAWTGYVVEDGPAFTGTDWNLKALDDPTVNLIGPRVLVNGSESESNQVVAATFTPLDRDRPVVVFGITDGFSGSLAIRADGLAAVEALEAFAGYHGLVYYETGFGDAKYIAITDTQWTRGGTRLAPWRVAAFDYAEVDSGLATST